MKKTTTQQQEQAAQRMQEFLEHLSVLKSLSERRQGTVMRFAQTLLESESEESEQASSTAAASPAKRAHLSLAVDNGHRLTSDRVENMGTGTGRPPRQSGP